MAMTEEKMTGDRLIAIAREAGKEFVDGSVVLYGSVFRKFITAAKKARDAGVDEVIITVAAGTFMADIDTIEADIDAIMDKIADEVGFDRGA